MRKASYLFLVLGLLGPFVTSWFVERARQEYFARTGFEADGIGLFATIAFGALATLALLMAAALCGAGSFGKLQAPRALSRKIELAMVCAPAVVVIGLFVAFWAMVPSATPA